MSSTPNLKRVDIVNYLENTKKIRPLDIEYSKEYLKYVCEQLGIEISDIHYEVRINISKIKGFYKACNHQFQKMKNKHKKFLNAFVKSKHLPPSPPLTPPQSGKKVCFIFSKTI